MDWNSLFSSLLGAVAGALLGGWVSYSIARYTLNREERRGNDTRLRSQLEERIGHQEAALRWMKQIQSMRDYFDMAPLFPRTVRAAELGSGSEAFATKVEAAIDEWARGKAAMQLTNCIAAMERMLTKTRGQLAKFGPDAPFAFEPLDELNRVAAEQAEAILQAVGLSPTANPSPIPERDQT